MNRTHMAVIAGVFMVFGWTLRSSADLQSGAQTSPRPQGSIEATVVDPVHYHVEFENEYVRVIRVKIPPGEGPVHNHPAPGGVVVYLTDQNMQQILADGKKVNNHYKAGQVRWASSTATHRDITSRAFELIRIEPKVR